MASRVIDELALLDATAQAELVRKKEVKPIELVEAAIQRIERLNPQLNAVITPMYDIARKVAAGPLPDGPFAGVPFLLKDLDSAYAGVRMAMGSRFLRDYVPDHDSELTLRFKRAGLIILGKTNAPEFGLPPTTEPELFGPTHNPWDMSRTPGGSSGGSAAAVAAGLVPVAHGGDGGGSIRIPASCCGLFGLKPTRARNPMGPDLGDALNGLIVNHVLTRSVRDSAAALDATSGPELGDPYWAPPPARPFIEEVGANPGRLRIAFSTEPLTGLPVHPDCIAAVQDAAKLCAELGHEVEEAAPEIIGALIVHAFTVVWSAGAALAMDGMALLTGRAPTQDQFETLTWALAEQSRKNSPSAYLLAVTILQGLGRTVAQFLTKYDLWLTPTLTEPPVLLGSFDSPPEDPLRGFERAKAFAPYTPIANATGQPAMSVPLYWNDDGLPIGTHFAARFGDEATLFRLAAQLEAARPWAQRRPPVTA